MDIADSAATMTDPVAQAALDRALDDTDQLILVYQPIHRATDGRIYAAEALLRQRRESGEVREASIITETAEESSGPELFALNNVLVKKAYTGAADWPKDIRLNVNLSPREFQEGNVHKRLTELVSSCGMDTRRINLELTETSYIEHPKETMEVLEILTAGLGVHLWLDDFGTGHSSLEHLQRFPVEGIKLPGAFIRELTTSARADEITRHLIALAHDLGMEVVAEEVETRDQFDFLRDQQCEYIQGYYFSREMECDVFTAFLAEESSRVDESASRRADERDQPAS